MHNTDILAILTSNDYFCTDGRTSPKASKKLKADPNLHQIISQALPGFVIDNISFANIVYALRHNLQSPPVCQCGKAIRFDKNLSTYSKTCSKKCGSVFSPTKTFKMRDVTKDADIMNKRIASRTNNFRSGIKHKLTDPDWLETEHCTNVRSISSIAEQLGVSYSTVARAIKEHNISSPSQKDLREASNMRRYGVKNVGELTDVRQKAITTQYNNKTDGWRSSGEQELYNYVLQIFDNNHDVVQHNVYGVIAPKELDIYIPSHNIAIEFCGLYWHSDKFKPNRYHKSKLDLCNAVGIRLITIFEDEWLSKQDIVKDKLLHILNKSAARTVYARQTTVVTMSSAEKTSFFDAHHIQGSGPGSITYGLSHNNNIVAAMTFFKQGGNEYVLNRYATSCSVVGGFSKLLNHFKRRHEWSKITSFADLRWSTGDLYRNTGWTLEHTLLPDYYWCKNGNRYHKFGFRHKHLKTKLDDYDPLLTENENCKRNGYTKIYNCGLHRYAITNTLPKDTLSDVRHK